MPRFKKRSWDDHITLLEYIATHTTKAAAIHFTKLEKKDVTVNAVRQRLYSAAKQIKEVQEKLNKVRTLQRISPRVRKLTTIGSVPEDEDLH